MSSKNCTIADIVYTAELQCVYYSKLVLKPFLSTLKLHVCSSVLLPYQGWVQFIFTDINSGQLLTFELKNRIREHQFFFLLLKSKCFFFNKILYFLYVWIRLTIHAGLCLSRGCSSWEPGTVWRCSVHGPLSVVIVCGRGSQGINIEEVLMCCKWLPMPF